MAPPVPLDYGLQCGDEQSPSVLPQLYQGAVDLTVGPQLHRWRARFRTNNPVFPVTPWFSIQGNGLTEAKIRTRGPKNRQL